MEITDNIREKITNIGVLLFSNQMKLEDALRNLKDLGVRTAHFSNDGKMCIIYNNAKTEMFYIQNEEDRRNGR